MIMKFLKFCTFSVLFLINAHLLNAQIDSFQTIKLEVVNINSYRFPVQDVKPLLSVHNGYITSGKKSEVIMVQDLPANISEKTGRQIFAKIPGAFIYDMDGSGNQLNIATRGLDPHRSWEYNIRQNGIMTNSDIYAYPASHYSPPMEAISRIEVIRGTSALQYGAQFGGMINYIVKQGDTSRAISFENINSVGSYGLLSSYNAISGKKGKLTYYGYYFARVSDGYRDDSDSKAQAQYGRIQYEFSSKLVFRAELGRSKYLYKNPGPLTDQMFNENPRQATRNRNYFSPDIYLPSISFDWDLGNSYKLKFDLSAVLGFRNSVQFIGFADMKDTINLTTGQYRNRQVDIDGFNSYSSELRLQKDYRFLNMQNTLIAATRYTDNDLHRRQLGKGSTGTNYDLNVEGTFGRDIRLKSQNIAYYIENLFRINSKFEVSTGVRIENGISKMRGIISYVPTDSLPLDITHKYPLVGISALYKYNQHIDVYTSFSQAYRPVVFSDLIPANQFERISRDIVDAFGYNAEFGFRGNIFNRLRFDVNGFFLRYNNRVGSTVLFDDKGQPFVMKENIGDSKTFGIEAYAEYLLTSTQKCKISVFTATSYMNGIYVNGDIRNGNENVNIKGNILETVPSWISRNGLQLNYRRLSAIAQHNYVSFSYSDALNTDNPSANGGRGIVPAYHVFDFNFALRINELLNVRLGLNNVMNTQYFTKRPTIYPGPGVWSSDGRSLVATFAMKL
jgi:Fe(3+) dicitrate transport protein